MAADDITPRQRWLGILLVVACAVLWSTSGTVIKLLHQDGGSPASASVPALAIACYRSLIGGLFFFPFALRHLGTLRTVKARWPIGSVASFTVMTLFFVLATTRTASANAIFLQNTSPIWVFIFSPLLLGERARVADAAVLAVAMVGVAVIFFGNPVTDRAAMFFALASGCGYGVLSVTLRGLRTVHPTVVASMNCLGSGLVLLPPTLASGALSVRGGKLALLIVFSTMQFALPYFLYSCALRYVRAQSASLVSLLETVLNPLWVFLILAEAPPRATLWGGPLILVGIAGWLVLRWIHPPQTQSGAQ